MRAAPEIKVLTGTITTTGVVTFTNADVDAVGVINVGFAIKSAAICVRDIGGIAVDWSFKVIGLPSSQTSLYGDLATVGETICDHTDTTQSGAIDSGETVGPCTAIFISPTVTNVGTATSFGIQVVLIGY